MLENEHTMSSLHDDDDITLDGGTEGEEGNKPTEPVPSAPSPREGGSTEEPTEPVEPSEPTEPAERSEPAEPTEPELPQASGVDQFLAQYGITDGMITFEAGEEGGEPTTQHFNELSQEEQFNVLSDLANSGAPKLEEKYGLDEKEIGLVNFVRENGGDVDQILNNMAMERLEQLQMIQNATGLDFDAMDNEAMMAKYLKDQEPEATEQEIADEVARRKEGKFFEKDVASIRDAYKSNAAAEAEAAKAQEAKDFEAELEEQRGIIATAVNEVDSVIGWKVDNNQKNEILSELLETNEEGDSKFMAEVFSDPQRLFKAAWLYHNAESYVDELEKHYKREVANAFHRGKEQAINGLPTTPIGSGNTAPTSGGVKPTTPTAPREEKVTTTGNLWDNEE